MKQADFNTTLTNNPTAETYKAALNAAIASAGDDDTKLKILADAVSGVLTMAGGKRRRRTNKRKGKGKKSRKY